MVVGKNEVVGKNMRWGGKKQNSMIFAFSRKCFHSLEKLCIHPQNVLRFLKKHLRENARALTIQPQKNPTLSSISFFFLQVSLGALYFA